MDISAKLAHKPDRGRVLLPPAPRAGSCRDATVPRSSPDPLARRASA